jgi:hypothetical protein
VGLLGGFVVELGFGRCPGFLGVALLSSWSVLVLGFWPFLDLLVVY